MLGQWSNCIQASSIGLQFCASCAVHLSSCEGAQWLEVRRAGPLPLAAVEAEDCMMCTCWWATC